MPALSAVAKDIHTRQGMSNMLAAGSRFQKASMVANTPT
jgi:hypothetical protein